MKKNILFIHPGAELYGADKILLEVLKGIDKNLFFPLVIIPNKGPLEDEFKRYNIKYIIYDFPILRRQYFNLFGITKYSFQFIKSLFYIRKIVNKYKINIICSNTLAILEGAVYSKLFKLTHVWHIHEIIKEPKIMDKFYKKIVPSLAQNVICVSNAVQNNLFVENNIDYTNVSVIHNGINITLNNNLCSKNIKQKLKIDDEKIIIGMVGRINRIKGQSYMVDVTKELIKKYPNLLLIMVGGIFEGQEQLKVDLENKISNNNLQNNIMLIDFDQDVDKYYNIFDIFILPSIKPDSFPTVVLEAMSHGKPIIAHVTGGVNEMVEDNKNGILIYDIDIKSTYNAIEKLIVNEELRQRYGQESKQIMRERFSSDIFYKKINDFYNSINVEN